MALLSSCLLLLDVVAQIRIALISVQKRPDSF